MGSGSFLSGRVIMSFKDRVRIVIRSGKGGDGHVSFRREKYVPNGGPDGGDGGRGGDVIFEVDEGESTLSDFRNMKKYQAKNGENGGKKNCHGGDGDDIIIKVPEGTVIREAQSGKVMADMSGDERRVVLLSGGAGGKGNQHYATARMQAPKYAQPGGPAKELEVILELMVIADVGLVGYPNVGKSTFLSKVTNAKPKIANYHFTTLAPNLGVVTFEGRSLFLADIPGLIDNASSGAGLGHEFLRHIQRTRVIIHMVDAAGSEGRDPVEDIKAINTELSLYDEELAKKPQIIAANKTDIIYEGSGMEDSVKRLRDEFEPMGIRVCPISALTGEGLTDLLHLAFEELDRLPKERIRFEKEYEPGDEATDEALPYTVEYDEKEEEYVIEGPRIEKMLGYTNLESEKGFAFFQNFLKENGILEELEAMGIEDGDTCRMYGLSFEYYK